MSYCMTTSGWLEEQQGSYTSKPILLGKCTYLQFFPALVDQYVHNFGISNVGMLLEEEGQVVPQLFLRR